MARLKRPQKSSSQADVEAGEVLPEVVVARISAAALAAVQIQRFRAGLLHLRITAALRDTELSPRFDDAQSGDLDVGVVRVRVGDQLVEHRIIEHGPPLLHVRLVADCG